jgi:hypothetical protein
LAADTKRTQLLAEEAHLIAEFDAQEQLTAHNGGTAACWTEAVWTERLARFAAVGAELEACGADASEAKVSKPLG